MIWRPVIVTLYRPSDVHVHLCFITILRLNNIYSWRLDNYHILFLQYHYKLTGDRITRWLKLSMLALLNFGFAVLHAYSHCPSLNTSVAVSCRSIRQQERMRLKNKQNYSHLLFTTVERFIVNTVRLVLQVIFAIDIVCELELVGNWHKLFTSDKQSEYITLEEEGWQWIAHYGFCLFYFRYRKSGIFIRIQYWGTVHYCIYHGIPSLCFIMLDVWSVGHPTSWSIFIASQAKCMIWALVTCARSWNSGR